MARASLQAVIDRLRFLTSASRTDEFGGVIYWSDDQLQEVLDLSRVDEPLRITLEKSDSGYFFTMPTYYAHEIVAVEDSQGNPVEDYTVEVYGQKVVFTFLEDDTYVATVVIYDINAAAAGVWERKAAQRQGLVSIRSGVHQIRAEQERDFCLQRARHYRARTAKVIPLPGSNRYVPAAVWSRR